MDHVGIGEVADLLATALGRMGARGHILARLRSDELSSTCARFVGVNPSAFSVTKYPEDVSDFRLPSIFWAPKYWMNDGEHVIDQSTSEREIWRRGQQVSIMPATQREPWCFTSDWAFGNFSMSTSYCRGTIPSSRRAVGVLLCKPQADLVLRAQGLPGLRPTFDELVSWMSERLTENSALSQNGAERIGRTAFPDEKRDYLRRAYQEAASRID